MNDRGVNMVALITGGAGGIGASLCREFATAGYKVAVNYFSSEENANSLTQEIKDSGGVAKAYKADVSDMEEVANMVAEVKKDFGDITVLVNNAGVAFQGLFSDTTQEVYEKVMDINVKGTFNTINAVLPGMISNKFGVVTNISSMWGQVGASCEVVYSTSKAAIIGLTKALAKEVGPSGIRVNCIAPGVIDTSMNDCHSEDDIKALIDETPLERIGNPIDVARTAIFLASEDASFITGQVIGVNGGFII